MQTYVLFQCLNKVKCEGVRHFVDFVEENIDKVIFYFELREFSGIVDLIWARDDLSRVRLLYKSLDSLIEDITNRLELLLLVGSHGGEAIMTVGRHAHLSSRRRLIAKVL